jgi:branched-chain amino acid transport system permease protein
VHSVAPPVFLQGSIALTDNLSYPVYRLAVCGFCLVVAVAIFVVLRHTGSAWSCGRVPRTAR